MLFLFEVSVKNLNKIHRNDGVSAEYTEVHNPNSIVYNPASKKNRGDILSHFYIVYGINKNEHDNFNLMNRVCINRYRNLFDLATCYEEA